MAINFSIHLEAFILIKTMNLSTEFVFWMAWSIYKIIFPKTEFIFTVFTPNLFILNIPDDVPH